ncbi:MAG: hypothetical protein NVSMB6_02330 [Burkholderiaceae bacterium]
MADISIREKHRLRAQKARAAVEGVGDEMAREFGAAIDWDENVLRFKHSRSRVP